MKNLVIIRTCKRDDFLAWYCYQSFKKFGVVADYLFFAEQDSYHWITQTKERIICRRYANNMGGAQNAIPYIEDLKTIDVEGYDRIIISDADIVILKNPFEVDCDFGGIQDANNKKHFSGQFQIYSNELFNKVINSDYKLLVEYFKSDNINIADDTLMSYVATTWAFKIHNFFNEDYWLHHKLYHLEHEFSRETAVAVL